jgi:hypothetical protein
MLKELVERLDVELAPDQLSEPLTLNVKGEVVPLGAWIDERAPARVLRAFGRKHVAPPVPTRSVRDLNEAELTTLAIAVLQRAPSDEYLAIVGVGEFSPKDLAEQVRRRTEVGVRMVDAIKRHAAFVEHAVSAGKIRRKREDDALELPAFEF